MRSPTLRIVLFGILFTGYSHAQSLATILRRNEGTSIYTAVLTFSDDVERCYLETPRGLVVEFAPTDQSNDKYESLPPTDVTKCHANVNNIDLDDNGSWSINSISTSGTKRSQRYNLTVIPIPDNRPQIEDLQSQYFNTKLGAKHTVFIRDYSFVTSERCLIITPSGEEYDLQEVNVPGVEVISHREATCAITINVDSGDVVGNWTLMAEGARFSDRILRRLPFTIHVEEIVNASVREVNVVEGNDLYLRLRNSTSKYKTCRLLTPGGEMCDKYEIDVRYVESCGYIVRNVQISDAGRWEIVYDDKIIYRAPTEVTVTAFTSGGPSELTWVKDRPVEEVLGSEYAVYCRLRNPEGIVVYDGFGRCRVNITRVSEEHRGIWWINVGLPGQVLTTNSQINVTLVEADPKPVVQTQVVVDKPIVILSCQVSSPHPVRTCKFRDPRGRVLLANEGVGQSRYSFHGSGVTYKSNLHKHDCGLRITGPVIADLGLWRCSLETEADTYHGFLRVICPWAMRDPEVAAAVITEPTLTADRGVVSHVVGDSVSMSCSIQSAIRYCYFRARNGTIFNVGPADPHDQATYVGAGFDAGECGIRFPTLAVSDTGTWSCHVGLPNEQDREQRARFNVTIHDTMVADQRLEDDSLIVEAQVYNNRTLEYCRFVRIDGLGFTTSTIPSNYINQSDLSRGTCRISTRSPSILDNHPWTVVARIQGQHAEISRVTPITLSPPTSPPESIIVYYRLPVAWVVVLAVGLAMILLATLLGSKGNRQWTYERASAIRNSFIKKKVVQENNPDKNTAIAA